LLLLFSNTMSSSSESEAPRQRTTKDVSSDDEGSGQEEHRRAQDEHAENKVKFTKRVDELLANLGEGYTRQGLTDDEAAKRLEQYGPNTLPTKKESLILKFLYFFWNPLSWAMEFAALLSFILVDYVDGILISALLLVNASIGMFSPIACVSSAECLQG
jgi:H+-transporting ATPase